MDGASGLHAAHVSGVVPGSGLRRLPEARADPGVDPDRSGPSGSRRARTGWPPPLPAHPAPGREEARSPPTRGAAARPSRVSCPAGKEAAAQQLRRRASGRAIHAQENQHAPLSASGSCADPRGTPLASFVDRSQRRGESMQVHDVMTSSPLSVTSICSGSSGHASTRTGGTT